MSLVSTTFQVLSSPSIFVLNDTRTTEIYTLSLHERSSDLRWSTGPRETVPARDPRCGAARGPRPAGRRPAGPEPHHIGGLGDRKSTRLNSSHANISYAATCLKKETMRARTHTTTVY